MAMDSADGAAGVVAVEVATRAARMADSPTLRRTMTEAVAPPRFALNVATSGARTMTAPADVAGEVVADAAATTAAVERASARATATTVVARVSARATATTVELAEVAVETMAAVVVATDAVAMAAATRAASNVVMVQQPARIRTAGAA